jgi:hypothetical protein
MHVPEGAFGSTCGHIVRPEARGYSLAQKSLFTLNKH